MSGVFGAGVVSCLEKFDIYKNIDTMDSLTLKIRRGKEEMELEYEIN